MKNIHLLIPLSFILLLTSCSNKAILIFDNMQQSAIYNSLDDDVTFKKFTSFKQGDNHFFSNLP